MKDPYELARDAEEHLAEFIDWQIATGPTSDFCKFARSHARPEDIFKYAAILYPRFIEVDGAVVLAEHYQEDNWRAWRQRERNPFAAAANVNHVHVHDFLFGDSVTVPALDRHLGHLLAFFWQLAVDHQFPSARVRVEYDGNVIDIRQPEHLRSS